MARAELRTLLFTDIEGSTAVLQRVGPSYGDLLARHHAILRASFGAHGGEEQGSEGDSLFVTFTSTSEAIVAAVEAQRLLLGEPWPSDARIKVRMGLHAGEVSESPAGLIGLAIHHAARIAAVGHGGQIVVSEAARVLASSLPATVGLRFLGAPAVRDVGSIALHQVIHADIAAAFSPLRVEGGGFNNLPAPLSSLVGRDSEAAAVMSLI